jgi:hypothetical protein
MHYCFSAVLCFSPCIYACNYSIFYSTQRIEITLFQLLYLKVIFLKKIIRFHCVFFHRNLLANQRAVLYLGVACPCRGEVGEGVLQVKEKLGEKVRKKTEKGIEEGIVQINAKKKGVDEKTCEDSKDDACAKIS